MDPKAAILAIIDLDKGDDDDRAEANYLRSELRTWLRRGGWLSAGNAAEVAVIMSL